MVLLVRWACYLLLLAVSSLRLLPAVTGGAALAVAVLTPVRAHGINVPRLQPPLAARVRTEILVPGWRGEPFAWSEPMSFSESHGWAALHREMALYDRYYSGRDSESW